MHTLTTAQKTVTAFIAHPRHKHYLKHGMALTLKATAINKRF
jgi:hypothetical protein